MHDDFGLSDVFVTLTRRPAKTYPVWLPLLPVDRIFYRGARPLACRCLSGNPGRRLSDHAALYASFALDTGVSAGYAHRGRQDGSNPPETPGALIMRSAIQMTYKLARRLVIGFFGLTLLLVGVAMILLPGPAFIVIRWAWDPRDRVHLGAALVENAEEPDRGGSSRGSWGRPVPATPERSRFFHNLWVRHGWIERHREPAQSPELFPFHRGALLLGLAWHGYPRAYVVVLLLSFVSDALDGSLARRSPGIELGSMLDTAADVVIL